MNIDPLEFVRSYRAPQLDPRAFVIDTPNVAESGARGFAQGAAIAGNLQNTYNASYDRAKGQADEAQMKADFAQLTQNHSPDAVNAMMLKYPKMFEPLQQLFKNMDATTRAARIKMLTPAYASALNGRMDLAQKHLLNEAKAMKNSGGKEEDIASMEEMANLATQDPGTFKFRLAAAASEAMGPELFSKTFSDLNAMQTDMDLAPYQQQEAQAKARENMYAGDVKAQEAAAFPEKLRLEQAKTQSEIDAKKEEMRINAMKAIYEKESNLEKRQELKTRIDTAEAAKAKAQSDIEDNASYNQAELDNVLETAERALTNPAITGEGEFTPTSGTVRNLASWVPFVANDTKALEADLETIKNNVFLQKFMSMKSGGGGTGLGALAIPEMEALKQAYAKLDAGLYTPVLRKNIETVMKMLKKANALTQKKAGVTKAGNTDINAQAEVLSKKSGLSISQALKYFQGQGKGQ